MLLPLNKKKINPAGQSVLGPKTKQRCHDDGADGRSVNARLARYFEMHPLEALDEVPKKYLILALSEPRSITGPNVNGRHRAVLWAPLLALTHLFGISRAKPSSSGEESDP